MNKRFREARKARGLTQDGVASLLSVSRGVVVNAELGRSSTTELYIRTFCSGLGISETWLRTGEGSMDAASQETSVRELAEAVARECGGNGVFRALIEVYLQLDPEGRETLARFVRTVAARVQLGETGLPPFPTADELDEGAPPEENEKSGAS